MPSWPPLQPILITRKRLCYFDEICNAGWQVVTLRWFNLTLRWTR